MVVQDKVIVSKMSLIYVGTGFTPLIIHLLANGLGKLGKMAQNVGSLPPTCDSWMKLQNTGLALVQLQPLKSPRKKKKTQNKTAFS